MKTLVFEDKDAWLYARLGKVTGTRLKDIVVKKGTGKKIGYYELIAERLGVPADGENPMERGSRLEAEALERFSKETGKELDTSRLLWVRDEDESIAVSPDAVVIGEKAAVETKCLSSARHIEAYLTQSIPDEYYYQMLQYFIVNDELEVLYFTFYDPRFTMFAPGGKLRKEGTSSVDFFVIKVERKDVEEEAKTLLELEKNTLAEINKIVADLTF